MATNTLMVERHTSSGGGKFILVIIALVIAFAGVVYAGSHADLKHPSDSEFVHQCIDKGRPTMIFLAFGSDNRYLRMCDLGNGKVGIQVLDKIGEQFKERTAYIKNNLHSLRDAMRWAQDSGHILTKMRIP